MHYAPIRSPDRHAGGDIVRGAAVVLAMGDGKKCAGTIDAWLKEKYAAVSPKV